MSLDLMKKFWDVLDFLDEISHLSYYSSHIVRESGLELMVFKCMSDVFEYKNSSLYLENEDQKESNGTNKMNNVWYIPENARWSTLPPSDTSFNLGENIRRAFLLVEENNPEIRGMFYSNFSKDNFDPKALKDFYTKLSFNINIIEKSYFIVSYINLFEFILSKSSQFSENTKRLIEYTISKLEKWV